MKNYLRIFAALLAASLMLSACAAPPAQQAQEATVTSDTLYVRKVENLPEALPSPLQRWATGESIPKEYDIDAAVQLPRVMEMAYAGC